MRERVLAMIFSTLDELEDPADGRPKTAWSEEHALIGRGGHLDSLGLINLVAGLEQRIEETLGVSVVLADERAMSQDESPFRTVKSLADYVERVLVDAGHG